MNTRFVNHRLGFIAIVAMLIAGTQVWGADAPPAPHVPPSKEMREKMAQVHESMAACLRSDRNISECHHEMMQACQELGGHGCGMMTHHHMKPNEVAKPSGSAAK